MLSCPGAFPIFSDLQIFSSSATVDGFKEIGSFSFFCKKDWKEEFVGGMLLDKFGPMLVKYLQNLLAISSGSIIVLPSDLKDEGEDGFFSCC